MPPGSVVRFRQPGLWERYGSLVCGGILFSAIEAALIIRLLVHRSRCRQGETVAALIADLSSRFVNLPSDEVNRMIEDAQRRVCECLGLDISTLWQWAPGESETLLMTHIYRRLPGPPTPERFEAREHLPWALRRLRYPDLTPERWHTFEAGIIRDQVLARGYSEVYEKEYRRKDQAVFPVELRAFLIRDESGRPEAMWAIVRDVTERNRDQEALRGLSARLIRTQEEPPQRTARSCRPQHLLDPRHDIRDPLASEATRPES